MRSSRDYEKETRKLTLLRIMEKKWLSEIFNGLWKRDKNMRSFVDYEEEKKN